MKIIETMIPKNLIANLFLPHFRSLLETKNNNQIFNKFVVWKRQIFLFFNFCLYRVKFYFRGIPNSTEFYKGILLHVIAVRITVP